ncbi:hypothetical protein BXT86_01480 [candidate division WOR-3 bacterium 4484_100]|uniref:HTH luxR-type domain-containing protein n=1 Tax=candidate division WOR-3 bacterium 4484_100 TaxID=1936077 RepID=A0A1V4QG94_UNCW3|nr:MAG: hypothetical protein BXT86_01480 [candidate division WOR-3 bacterium 4484_100]
MSEKDNLKDLIKRAIRDDEEACNRILNLYKGRIFSYVYRMVRNYHDAEDITFDVFIKCFKNLPKFDLSRPFIPWLFSIAHNQVIDFFRKHRIEYEYLDERQSTEDGPESRYEKKIIVEKVEKAIARLSPLDRELVILFHKEEHSYQEISEILNLPISTIKTRLHRARKRLRELIK